MLLLWGFCIISAFEILYDGRMRDIDTIDITMAKFYKIYTTLQLIFLLVRQITDQVENKQHLPYYSGYFILVRTVRKVGLRSTKLHWNAHGVLVGPSSSDVYITPLAMNGWNYCELYFTCTANTLIWSKAHIKGVVIFQWLVNQCLIDIGQNVKEHKNKTNMDYKSITKIKSSNFIITGV